VHILLNYLNATLQIPVFGHYFSRNSQWLLNPRARSRGGAHRLNNFNNVNSVNNATFTSPGDARRTSGATPATGYAIVPAALPGDAVARAGHGRL
jgi:hypothetical protein